MSTASGERGGDVAVVFVVFVGEEAGVGEDIRPCNLHVSKGERGEEAAESESSGVSNTCSILSCLFLLLSAVVGLTSKKKLLPIIVITIPTHNFFLVNM